MQRETKKDKFKIRKEPEEMEKTKYIILGNAKCKSCKYFKYRRNFL